VDHNPTVGLAGQSEAYEDSGTASSEEDGQAGYDDDEEYEEDVSGDRNKMI
jgi:hypothetical protein